RAGGAAAAPRPQTPRAPRAARASGAAAARRELASAARSVPTRVSAFPSARQRLVADAVRLRGVLAPAAPEILHVLPVIAFEPHHLRVALVGADPDHVEAAGDLLPDGLAVIERLARLIDVREAHALAEADRAGIGRLAPGQHAKEGRLAGAVRADDADDSAPRHSEAQVVDQQPLAVALAEPLDLDHQIPEPLSGRDVDLVGFVALLEFARGELLVALE